MRVALLTNRTSLRRELPRMTLPWHPLDRLAVHPLLASPLATTTTLLPRELLHHHLRSSVPATNPLAPYTATLIVPATHKPLHSRGAVTSRNTAVVVTLPWMRRWLEFCVVRKRRRGRKLLAKAHQYFAGCPTLSGMDAASATNPFLFTIKLQLSAPWKSAALSTSAAPYLLPR